MKPTPKILLNLIKASFIMLHSEATGRAAITGNPGDVYLKNALVLAYSIKNKAVVTLEDSAKLEISSPENLDPGHRLITQALKHFNIPQPLRISYSSNIPYMAGLGGSAAILTALISGLNQKYNLNLSNLKISQHALAIEHELGIKAGWQDRAAAVFGSSLINCKNLSCTKLKSIPENMFVAYYGKESSSGQIHKQGEEKSNDAEFHKLMSQTRILTKQAYKAIEKKDWLKLGKLMNRNWDIREQTLGLTKKDKQIKDLIFENKGYANQAGSGGSAVILDLNRTIKPVLKENNISTLDVVLNGGVKLWEP